MKLYLDFWWRIGFALHLWRRSFEMDTLAYFFGRVWFRKYQLTINLYRHERRGFMFHINLPYFSIMNDEMQESVSIGTDPMYRIVPVVTGKLFGKRIGRRKL